MNIKELQNKINSLNNNKFKIFQNNINNSLYILTELFNKQKGGNNTKNIIKNIFKKYNIHISDKKTSLIKKEIFKLNNNIKGGINVALNMGKSLAFNQMGEEDGLSFTDIYDLVITYKGLVLQFVENRWKWTEWLFMGINIILYIFSAFSPIILSISINLFRFLMNALRNDKVSMILDIITIIIPISNAIFILPFSMIRFLKQSLKKIKDEEINLADSGFLKPLYNKGDELALKLYRKENPDDYEQQTKKWNELSEYEQNKYVLRIKTNKETTSKSKSKSTSTSKSKSTSTSTSKSKSKKGGSIPTNYDFINYLKYKTTYLNKKYIKYF